MAALKGAPDIDMLTITIASQNPVKVQATIHGFRRMFPEVEFETKICSVPSGVSAQPFSSQETMQGAINRAQHARLLLPQSDYWVGIEGGVQEFGQEGEADHLAAFAWVIILSQDKQGRGSTGSFFLPTQVAQLVRQGKELGEADDIVFGRQNSKQQNGAVGILTSEVIDRVQLYEQAVILALIPFKNPGLYPSPSKAA